MGQAPVPKPRIARLLGGTAGTVTALLALFLGAYGVLALTDYGLTQAMPELQPDLGQLDWYVAEQYRLAAIAALIVLPLGVLASLPLRYAWDKTLGTLMRLGLVLYGVAISAGLASKLTGTLIAVVREFAS